MKYLQNPYGTIRLCKKTNQLLPTMHLSYKCVVNKAERRLRWLPSGARINPYSQSTRGWLLIMMSSVFMKTCSCSRAATSRWGRQSWKEINESYDRAAQVWQAAVSRSLRTPLPPGALSTSMIALLKSWNLTSSPLIKCHSVSQTKASPVSGQTRANKTR